MLGEENRLPELLSDAISTKIQQHRQQEQQQVDALLASQKHLTSNLRTLISSLDTILQLSTPRYSSSQGELVGSCASRARALGHRLDLVGARLARIQDHLEQEEVKLGLRQPAAAAAADIADTGAEADSAAEARASADSTTTADDDDKPALEQSLPQLQP